jgi:hypothetical protein
LGILKSFSKMAMKTFAPVLLVALALFALATPSTAARNLLTTTSCDDTCKMNNALVSAHLYANFLSCAAHGVPISGSDYCGPNDGPVLNCQQAPLSVDAKAKIEIILANVKAEIKLLRIALGAKVQVLPKVDIKVFINKVLTAALNVDVGTFNCYGGDNEVYLCAFILADLHVNILVSLKYLLNVNVYLNVVLQVLSTCQTDLANIQAQLSLIANVVICASLNVQVVLNACIKYLDAGLCAVLGISLQVILGPVLVLLNGLLGLVLNINLSALLNVFVQLCAIVQLCIV